MQVFLALMCVYTLFWLTLYLKMFISCNSVLVLTKRVNDDIRTDWHLCLPLLPQHNQYCDLLQSCAQHESRYEVESILFEFDERLRRLFFCVGQGHRRLRFFFFFTI